MKIVARPNNTSWIIADDGNLLVDNQLDTVPLITVSIITGRDMQSVYVLYPDQREEIVPTADIALLATPGQIIGNLYSPGLLCKVAQRYNGKLSDRMRRLYISTFADNVHRNTTEKYDSSKDDGYC